MKRRYTTPTAAVLTFGDDLMRSQMATWSLGRVTKDDTGSSIWNTEELHPVEENKDWTGRLNTDADAWGTDTWGGSE